MAQESVEALWTAALRPVSEGTELGLTYCRMIDRADAGKVKLVLYWKPAGSSGIDDIWHKQPFKVLAKLTIPAGATAAVKAELLQLASQSQGEVPELQIPDDAQIHRWLTGSCEAAALTDLPPDTPPPDAPAPEPGQPVEPAADHAAALHRELQAQHSAGCEASEAHSGAHGLKHSASWKPQPAARSKAPRAAVAAASVHFAEDEDESPLPSGGAVSMVRPIS
jgi:hypothetical protein